MDTRTDYICDHVQLTKTNIYELTLLFPNFSILLATTPIFRQILVFLWASKEQK